MGRMMGVHGKGVVLWVLLLMLVGCSEPGDGAALEVPPAPVLHLDYRAVKVFAFSWQDVEGETEYRLLEDPDGRSGYRQVARLGADATGHRLEVFLPGRLEARYRLQACNNVGCRDSNEVVVDVPALVRAVGYIEGPGIGMAELFGHIVSLSDDGNTLAVGVPRKFSNVANLWAVRSRSKKWADALLVPGQGVGGVYVFTRNGGTWRRQVYIKASNAGKGDMFGYAVALSGDGRTLAVGAHRESSAATGIGGAQDDDSTPKAGAVYVFTRSGETWQQQAYVKASNVGEGDWFGHSVALSEDGHTLAVGAIGESSAATGIGGAQDDDSAPKAGAVYVFTRSGGTWRQQAYVKASNTGKGDWFGHAVALSGDGNILAVGIPRKFSYFIGLWDAQSHGSGRGGAAFALGEGAGGAYVFTRSGGTWREQAYIEGSNAGEGNWFGYSVALTDDGNTLAVGAPKEDSRRMQTESISIRDQEIVIKKREAILMNTGAVYLY